MTRDKDLHNCPICGCIEDENRQNQEVFECVECRHKDKADFNAAKIIQLHLNSA